MRIDRRYRRRRLNRSQAILTDVLVQEGGTSGRVNGQMTVLGRGGAFVETRAESRQGSPVFLSFTLPPQRVAMRCAGIVRECARGVGVGVEFTDLATPDADRISAFVELAGHSAGDGPRDERRFHHGERKTPEESAIPTGTPHVRTSDSSTSDRAKTSTGNNDEGRSGVVSTPVKSSVERQESQTHAKERTGQSRQEFELQLAGALNNNIRRAAKFTGALLASGSGSQVDGDTAHYTLFLTRGGNLVVHATSGQGSTVEVFRCFDDFKETIENRENGEYRLAFGNVLPEVAKVLGEDYTLWID